MVVSRVRISKTRTCLSSVAKKSVEEKKIKEASDSRCLTACPVTGRPKYRHKSQRWDAGVSLPQRQGEGKDWVLRDVLPREESKLRTLLVACALHDLGRIVMCQQ